MSQQTAMILSPRGSNSLTLIHDAQVIGPKQWDVIKRMGTDRVLMAASTSEQQSLYKLEARGLVTRTRTGSNQLGWTVTFTATDKLLDSWLVVR